MVEEQVGVEAAALEVRLEVQVLSGGAACAACQSDDLACLHLVAHLYEVLGLVRVERLQTVGVLQHYAVAVAEVWR